MAGTIRGGVHPRSRKATRLNGVRPRWPEQLTVYRRIIPAGRVSMESGLDGRNNLSALGNIGNVLLVSMESGLDGRNNGLRSAMRTRTPLCLNGVRPRWPEQCGSSDAAARTATQRLNGVRPRWPEQYGVEDPAPNPLEESQWSPA